MAYLDREKEGSKKAAEVEPEEKAAPELMAVTVQVGAGMCELDIFCSKRN